MVKILSNGDIVPDDDPRAQQRSSTGGSNARPRQGFVRHDDANPYQQQQQQFGGGMYGGGQVSVFTMLNQKLTDLGVPRFNAGPYVIEPIALVGFILAGLIFGLPGLLFGAILFFIVTSSQSTNAAQGSNQGGGSTRNQGGGGGHRLGR